MRTSHPLLLAALFAALLGPAARAADPDPKGVAFFEARIHAVLVEHCYGCHSADAAKANKLKAGLTLDTRNGLRTGSDSGPAVVPGKPDESLLIQSLRHAPGTSAMPPKGELAAAVVTDFEAWVKIGALDPRSGAATVARKGMRLDDGRRFWSFVPPRDPGPPAVKETAWPLGNVDRFVLAAREAKRLMPASDADRRALASYRLSSRTSYLDGPVLR